MYLVFDVGATTIKYALMTGEGEFLEKGKTPTPVGLYREVNDFVEAIGEVYDKYAHQVEAIEGIAMGMPGQIDVKRGIVYNGGGIQYMHEVPIRDLVQSRCDNIPVTVENDGKCAALAEIWKGNAKDVKDACVIVFGTGIGGGIIRNRKVIHGKHLLAGELSFILDEMKREDLDKLPPGDRLMETLPFSVVAEKFPVAWSTKCSSVNMCQNIARAKGIPFEGVTGEKVYQWIREGDELVKNMVEDVYFCIAKWCISLFVILDPEIILIGGGISAEPEFIKGIQKYVERLKPISNLYTKIKLDTCKFLNDSNLLGALFNFKQIHNLL